MQDTVRWLASMEGQLLPLARLTANQTTLKVGDAATIHVRGQGTGSGLYSVVGDITAAND